MSFARELSRRALSIRLETAPAEAAHIGRRAIADTVGVALAGANAPIWTRWRRCWTPPPRPVR
ncbi:hypothetical protein ACFSS8_14700 [Paracoccus kondratievae]